MTSVLRVELKPSIEAAPAVGQIQRRPEREGQMPTGLG
jgi:hypothetical protein